MDMYRQHYPDNTLIFLFISDDPQWAREKLLPRVKTKGMHKIVFIKTTLGIFCRPDHHWDPGGPSI